jgi:hypothetical protein
VDYYLRIYLRQYTPICYLLTFGQPHSWSSTYVPAACSPTRALSSAYTSHCRRPTHRTTSSSVSCRYTVRHRSAHCVFNFPPLRTMPRSNKADRSGSVDLTDVNPSQAHDDYILDRFDLMLNKTSKMMIDSFNICLTQMARVIEDKLNVKIDAQANDIFTLSAKVDKLEKRNDELVMECGKLRADLKAQSQMVTHLSTTLDDLEQYTRVDNLLIHGLPLPPNPADENLYLSVPDALNQHFGGMGITPEMISVVHRLPAARPSTDAASSSRTTNKPPPIIIKFVRRATRINLLQNRRQLKGKQLVITEHLTPKRAGLLKKANGLVQARKLISAWSQDGKVLVKTLLNRVVPIINELDLEQFTG